jgi:hypothetical protein
VVVVVVVVISPTVRAPVKAALRSPRHLIRRAAMKTICRFN